MPFEIAPPPPKLRSEKPKDVTADRALDTQYTNDTGKLLLVYVFVDPTADGKKGYMIVDGVQIWCVESYRTTGHYRVTFFGIVRDGGTYKLDSAGGFKLTSWLEQKVWTE